MFGLIIRFASDEMLSYDTGLSTVPIFWIDNSISLPNTTKLISPQPLVICIDDRLLDRLRIIILHTPCGSELGRINRRRSTNARYWRHDMHLSPRFATLIILIMSDHWRAAWRHAIRIHA